MKSRLEELHSSTRFNKKAFDKQGYGWCFHCDLLVEHGMATYEGIPTCDNGETVCCPRCYADTVLVSGYTEAEYEALRIKYLTHMPGTEAYFMAYAELLKQLDDARRGLGRDGPLKEHLEAIRAILDRLDAICKEQS